MSLFLIIFLISKEVDTFSFGYKLVNSAKEYIGVPYKFDGRNRDGLDCMGVIFLAYSKVTGKRWQNLSVYPSKLVKSGELGKPIEWFDVKVIEEDTSYTEKLKVGDIIYFLSPFFEIKDEPLAIINGVKYWPWHMGIYCGKDSVLHANPIPNENTPASVIIESLKELIKRTKTTTKAILVTRK